MNSPPPVIIEPEFLEGFDQGPRFALYVRPRTEPLHGSVLCVQPFAEEMSASRRVLLAQAVRLATAGWGVMILDLFGTGDSAGEIEEASLTMWRRDLLRASLLVRARFPGPSVLWGIRFGAVLVADLATALQGVTDALIFWQPVQSGAAVIEQLYRSKHASKPTGVASHTTLAGFHFPIRLLDDIAGMGAGLTRVLAHAPSPPVLTLALQRGALEGTPLPRAVGELATSWRECGYGVRGETVRGEPFWNSLEAALPEAAFVATEMFLSVLAAENAAA